MTDAPRRHGRAGLTRSAFAASTALALLAAAGCSSSGGHHPAAGSSTSGSSSASTPAGPVSAPSAASTVAPSAAQLKALLISPSAIPVDRFSLASTSPLSEGGAVGISAIYANSAKDRVLSVILIRYPTVAFAQAGLSQIQALSNETITKDLRNSPAVVGQNGRLFQGSDATGPVSILVFGEGNYNVTMQFVSKHAGDDVPASVVLAVGAAQAAKVQAG